MEFQIEGKNYRLFIVKRFCSQKFYLFKKLENGILEPIPVEKMTTSTMGILWRVFQTRKGVREMWHIKEILLEYGIPAAMGVLGSFVGLGIAHWLGIA